jgi:hypothetical protein
MTSSASNATVAESAGKGIAAYLRGNPDLPVAAFVNAVHATLRSPELPFQPPESAWPGAQTLMSRLEELVSSNGYKEGAQLCQRAAWKSFVGLEGSATLSREEVAACFAAELSWEVAERKCVAIGRDEVARQTGRSIKEELDVENELRKKVKELGRRFGKQFAAGRALSDVRAPSRHTPLQSVDNILHQTLPVMTVSVPNEK